MGLVFNLLYHQHGGSGLNLQYDTIMEMELDEILWWVGKLTETRQLEADALRKK